MSDWLTVLMWVGIVYVCGCWLQHLIFAATRDAIIATRPAKADPPAREPDPVMREVVEDMGPISGGYR